MHVAQENRVTGQAAIGDKVTYFDIANQDGAVWEVISLPSDNVDPEFGWTKGYGLVNVESSIKNFSDLRQYGWTFAL